MESKWESRWFWFCIDLITNLRYFCIDFECSLFFSYHQKFRLQGHKEFAKTLGLNSDLLLTSHVAAKLNGYLVGVGGVKQFKAEVASLGLQESQKDYVLHYVRKNENSGLSCWNYSWHYKCIENFVTLILFPNLLNHLSPCNIYLA